MTSEKEPYQITPMKLGVEIRGLNLMSQISQDVIKRIIDDSHKYRLLIFRDQADLSPQRHIEISRWFGELDSEPFYKHPKSPDHNIFRVSNLESEGCRNVGRTGWHIDGSFRTKPYSHSLYHMFRVPKEGDTRFVGMEEIWSMLPQNQRDRWNRLWMISDRREKIIHPLVHKHANTARTALCFHLGMTDGFLWDKGSKSERMTDLSETSEILEEIYHAIMVDNGKLVYSHKWEPGDFVISDNLAVGHEASPESQSPVEDVGLRVLHRVTVAGKFVLKK